MKAACKRGHPLTSRNAHWHKRADGRRYYTCKTCHNILQKLRYRHDDNFRAAERQRCLTGYYARKEMQCSTPSPQ